MRRTISSVTAWIDEAKFTSRSVMSLSDFLGGPSNNDENLLFVIVSPWQLP